MKKTPEDNDLEQQAAGGSGNIYNYFQGATIHNMVINAGGYRGEGKAHRCQMEMGRGEMAVELRGRLSLEDSGLLQTYRPAEVQP